MIVGLGVDIVEVARIARSMKNPKFVERILTEAERQRPLTPQYVAGRWAAKEAVAKSWGGPLKWREVEILTQTDGRPAASVSRSHPLYALTELTVSISHERGHAVAVAILEHVPDRLSQS